jgi:hypothetical protein
MQNSYGEQKQILTHVFGEHYESPMGLRIDGRSPNDDGVIDNEKFLGFNLDEKCELLVNQS